jgi:hypothetical protein
MASDDAVVIAAVSRANWARWQLAGAVGAVNQAAAALTQANQGVAEAEASAPKSRTPGVVIVDGHIEYAAL